MSSNSTTVHVDSVELEQVQSHKLLGVIIDTQLEVARLDFFLGGGGYLPSLSMNYVSMSKHMGKRLPQLYYIKMKISYNLGFIAIGVAMAT